MAREEDRNIEAEEDEMEDEQEDMMEDNMEMNQDLQEQYGYPTPEPKFNQHVFLNKAAFESEDTIRTTYLSEWELGRPTFTVRFLLDLYKMAEFELIPPTFENSKVKPYNFIATYFKEKIQNITHSGMSNKGFAMNLNVTQRRDVTKKRDRNTSGLKNQSEKGGNEQIA